MVFSTDDERWPFMAVVVWIATRCFERMRQDAAKNFPHFENDLASWRNGVAGHLPRGFTAQQAIGELEKGIEHGIIASFAAELAISRRPHLPANPRQNSTQSPDLRDLTFARTEALRLWPEYPQAIAYERANKTSWTPPSGLDNAALTMLPEGKRVPLTPTVNMLAFVQVDAPANLPEVEKITKRIQAANALFAAARDDGVTIYGTPARRRASSGQPLEPAGPPGLIAPMEFDNNALALSHQEQSAIGARFVAENYADQGGHPAGVKWFGVTVDKQSLEDWLGALSKDEPTVRGAKGNGGRPPAVDWTVVGEEINRLMNDNGDFGADAPHWNAKARLEERIEEFCFKKFKKRPARSTIQENITPLLAAWRSSKSRSP